MVPSNVKKKEREPPNVTKVQSHVMLVLRFETSTIKYEEKNKGTTEYDKSTVTCNVGTAQYDNNTIKCGKKKRTTECDKSTVTCNVGAT